MNLAFKIYVPVFISAIMLSVFLPFHTLINFFHDDSFFYMKTAWNSAIGVGSTFDGINDTNGYHPLWFGVLSVVMFITKFFTILTPEMVMRVVFFLQMMIVSGILYVNFRLLKKLFYDSQTFVLLVPVLVIPVLIRDYGVESQLAVLLISIYLLMKVGEYGGEKFSSWGKGIFVSLLFLTRTDFLWSVIPLIIIAEYLTSRTGERRSVFVVTLAVVVTAVMYYTFNFIYYGHFLPVSAAISNAFPDTVIIKNFKKLIYSPHNWLNITGRFLIVVASTIATYFMYRRKFAGEKFSLLLLLMNIGVLIFCLLHLVFNNYGLREWYITMPSYIACLTLVLAFVQFGRFYKTAVVTLVLIAIVGVYELRVASDKFDSVYEYSMLLKENTNESDRIFQTDFSGMVGFFSGRQVINGDGFINSYEYRDYVLSGRLYDYFRDYGITHYSTYTFNQPDQRGELFTDFIAGIYIADYEAVISRTNEVLMLPYRFSHGLSKYSGFWYLFRTGDGFEIRVIEERPS